MNAATEKTLACETNTDANRAQSVTFNRPHPWRLDRDNADMRCTVDPISIPTLPTADDYAEGMKKLRATANCPVLSPEETLLAQEFATYPDIDTDAPSLIDDLDAEQLKAAKKRKTVAEYLKEQHREDMLRRMPRFEQQTHDELRSLRAEVSSLGIYLAVTNLIMLVMMVIGGVAWLL